jgi:hypothetical protein
MSNIFRVKYLPLTGDVPSLILPIDKNILERETYYDN